MTAERALAEAKLVVADIFVEVVVTKPVVVAAAGPVACGGPLSGSVVPVDAFAAEGAGLAAFEAASILGVAVAISFALPEAVVAAVDPPGLAGRNSRCRRDYQYHPNRPCHPYYRYRQYHRTLSYQGKAFRGLLSKDRRRSPLPRFLVS